MALLYFHRYARVANMIEIEVEIDTEVPAAEVQVRMESPQVKSLPNHIVLCT